MWLTRRREIQQVQTESSFVARWARKCGRRDPRSIPLGHLAKATLPVTFQRRPTPPEALLPTCAPGQPSQLRTLQLLHQCLHLNAPVHEQPHIVLTFEASRIHFPKMGSKWRPNGTQIFTPHAKATHNLTLPSRTTLKLCTRFHKPCTRLS